MCTISHWRNKWSVSATSLYTTCPATTSEMSSLDHFASVQIFLRQIPFRRICTLIDEDPWLDEWVYPSKLRGINWLFNRAIHWRRDTLCLSGLDEWFNECLALYPRMSEALAWEHTCTTSLVQFMAVRFASSPLQPRHLSIVFGQDRVWIILHLDLWDI